MFTELYLLGTALKKSALVQASKKAITHTSKLKSITKYQLLTRGVARIFQRGGHRGYSPAALPRVSAGSVVLSRHQGPY